MKKISSGVRGLVGRVKGGINSKACSSTDDGNGGNGGSDGRDGMGSDGMSVSDNSEHRGSLPEPPASGDVGSHDEGGGGDYPAEMKDAGDGSSGGGFADPSVDEMLPPGPGPVDRSSRKRMPIINDPEGEFSWQGGSVGAGGGVGEKTLRHHQLVRVEGRVGVVPSESFLYFFAQLLFSLF